MSELTLAFKNEQLRKALALAMGDAKCDSECVGSYVGCTSCEEKIQELIGTVRSQEEKIIAALEHICDRAREESVLLSELAALDAARKGD